MIAQIPAPPTNALELGPLSLHLYGLMIAIGVLLAISVARRRYAGYGYDADQVDRAAIVAVVAGFLGARFGFVVWRLDRYFPDDPLGVFAIWRGGLVLFGGLLFGVVAAYLYTRRTRMDTAAFADAAAPAIPLAQAFGRWGNYFNQELYGRPTDLPWALEVDPAYRAAEYQQYATFHPTFLYESLGNLVLVAVLLAVDRYGKLRRGSLMFAYAAGYGALRFSVELLRVDTEFRLLGLSRNNWTFLLVSLAGIVGLVWWQRRAAPARGRAKTR
jgi:prolipoprotein diacylglyceryl transferase